MVVGERVSTSEARTLWPETWARRAVGYPRLSQRISTLSGGRSGLLCGCPLCGKTVGLQPTSNLSSMISYKRPRKLDVLPVPHYHTYSHSSTHDRPTVRGLTRWPRDRWTTRHINKEHKRERHRVRYCVAAPSGGRTLQASRRNQDAGRGLRQRTAKSVATQAVHTPHAAHRLRVRGRVAPYVAS